MRHARHVLGWVIYDFATVLFAMNVAGLYFPLWVTEDAGGSDRHVAFAISGAMLIILAAAPFLGSYADRSGHRVPLLGLTTVACAGLTMLIGHVGLFFSLVVFALAYAANGCGLVFYDALLPVVSNDRNRGRISGYGIAAGFIGAITGVLIGAVILALVADGKPLVFKVTAVLFVLGTIPCLLWVREPKRGVGAGRTDLIADLQMTWRLTQALPGVRRFLTGRVLYTDAANTIFAFMSVYSVKEIGFSETTTQFVLLSGILAGPVGALAAGQATDRIGALRTVNWFLCLWVVVLLICSLIPWLGLPSALFWVVAPLVGFAFGGTGTADRALLLDLTPVEHSGRFFGVFAMVGRLSAVVGPLLWALIVEGLDLGRPAAVASLAAMVFLAWTSFRLLPATNAEPTAAPSVDGAVTMTLGSGTTGG